MGQYADLFADPRAPLAVRLGAQANPDQQAEVNALARRYQAPPGVVEQYRDDYKGRAATDDALAVFERAPRLGSWIAEQPDRAKIAHDDIDSLGAMEVALRTLKEMGQSVVAAFPSASAGLYGTAAMPFEVTGQGLRAADDFLARGMGLDRAPGQNPGEVIGAGLRSLQQRAQGVEKQVGPDLPADAGIIRRGVSSGVQSATQTLLTLPVALRQGGEKVALGVLGAITGGQAYGKAREQGLDPARAAVYGIEDAVAEVVTERIPMGKLIGDMKAGTGAAKMLVSNLVRELPTELAATTWQSFNEWLNLSPGATIGEWASTLPEQLGQTVVATLVGGATQVGAIKGVERALGRQEEQAKKADAAAAQIEQLMQVFEASKLRERDADSFRGLVAQIAEEDGDAPAELFIDGQTLANSLAQSGISIEEIAAIAPTVAEQLRSPNTGSDIRIPVAEFALAGEALTAPLLDHLKTTPDAMSRAEAAEYLKDQSGQIEADVSQALEQEAEHEEFRAEVDVVRGEFEQQLASVNRFTPDVNKAYASLLANFYAAQSARVGLTPAQMVDRYQLRIAAQSVIGKMVLQQGGADRGALTFADDITQQASVISLLKGADLTTLIHESGHFFLEVQADLASRISGGIASGESVSDGELAIVGDMNTMLAWFGIKGTPEQSAIGEWSSMTLEQKREHHEKWARGFEAYAFEGKAPSIELQGLFQRFRSWLVSVYKTLRNLNVELSDDVRAVMGRMLASDFAIEEAEAQRNMGPLFRDAESAGMTMEEFSAYQATAEGATAAAVEQLQSRGLKDMKWLSRARDKAIKARQQEVEELRREIRNEVRSEVMAEPVYQAWQFLSGKKDVVLPGTTADVDTIATSGRLRTQVLRDMYGTDENAIWRELSARRMTSDDKGMHPDIVGEMFGYDSGDALVQALVSAIPPQEVIDARTDQRMLEMFGDIGSQEALDRAADEAVHNEARARFIASELKALQAANSVKEKRGKGTVDVMARAAKGYAQAIISRLKIREIKPGHYASAEARNAKLAEKAFAAGKTEEAALHKRNQLVNNYATRAAYEAQEEVKAAVGYFRKFDNRSKSIDAEYADQIEAILERFDFRPTSLIEIDRRKSFREWYDKQVAMGVEPNIAPELLDEASRRPYKDMTLEELRGLVEGVKQIEHLGRLKNKLLLARDEREFDAAATDMADSIIEHGGEAIPVQLEGPSHVADGFDWFAAVHRKLPSLFRQMDGGNDNGQMYQLIGRAMNERGTIEDSMIERATVALSNLYDPLLKLRGGIAGYRSKLFIPEINSSLTRGGRLAVALNWGNEANRQRLQGMYEGGNQWSAGQVQAILKTLSPTELNFVNGIWEYIDTYWEDVAAKAKRLTGVEPEKVEAQPFVVMASDGTEVAMRGGYYPLAYDSNRSDRSRKQEHAQLAEEMKRGAVSKATTRRGHEEARLKEVKRPVRLDLNVITQHITQVTHDLAWHEWLIDTNRLLDESRVVSAINAHYGPRVLDTIRSNIDGIATGDLQPQTIIDKGLLLLRSNVTRATMGASLTTAFLQPFGLTQSMVRIGSKHVLRGAARWAGDAARMESSIAWINQKSEFMRLRSKTFNRELREIRGTVAGKSKAMKVADAGLFWLMQKMQLVADVPTWIGQHEKSKAEGLDDDAAVAMADRAVLESQGGGQTKDMAEVQRKHPMLTQFYSYFSVTLNLAAESTAATDFKNPRAVAGWLGDMALLLVIPAIGPALILDALKGGDDEEPLAKKLAKWQAGYLLGMVVGLREFSGAVSGFDYAGPPVGRIVGDVGTFGKQLAQGEIDEPLVLALVRTMSDAFGLPAAQAIRSYRGWQAWDEGEAPASAILFGPPPKD